MRSLYDGFNSCTNGNDRMTTCPIDERRSVHSTFPQSEAVQGVFRGQHSVLRVFGFIIIVMESQYVFSKLPFLNVSASDA